MPQSMTQIRLFEDLPLLWRHIPIEDPRIAKLIDGPTWKEGDASAHYSRQTPGSKGAVPPGRRFALWHDGSGGSAVWAVCLNKEPGTSGRYQWRNSIFHNASSTQSSTLIAAATEQTYEMWRRRYHELPAIPLRSEVDIEATKRRRSKRHLPGHCYLMAGWTHVEDRPREHGRAAKAIFQAPPPQTTTAA